MLKVKPYEQQYSGYCGPASLKMVLDYYDVKKSESELARLAKSTKAKGTSGENLVKAARRLGFKAFLKDSAEISEVKKYVLNKKIPVMVNWFSRDDGHYSVVAGIDKKYIYLQDPELGGINKIELKKFKRIWFGFEGKYLRTKNDIIIRRMIVINN